MPEVHHNFMGSPRIQSDSFSVYASKPVPPRVMQRLEVQVQEQLPNAPARIYPYVKRLLDILVSSFLLAVLSPLFVVISLVLWLKQGGWIFCRTPRLGKDCRIFIRYTFATRLRYFHKLPLLFNILIGDLSFIGPRSVGPGELCHLCLQEPLVRRRCRIRPGLICDWWIRRHASLGYVQETELDALYVENPTFSKDVSIILRAMPSIIAALIWGDNPADYTAEFHLLGIRIDNATMPSAIKRIVEMLDSEQPNQVCFVNPHYINEACRVPEYKQVLDQANLVLADGFGTKLAGKILHRPIRQNLCGTDLFPRLCAALNGSGKRIFLLGAAPGAAEGVAEWVLERYPDVLISGTHHGFFTPEEEGGVVRQIAASGADLLVVAMGVPRQELWVHHHAGELGVKAAIGFGGLFDYFAGRVPRAPQWVREIGMEWVYRLIQEPRRMWRRYLIGNALFLARVMHERLFPKAWAPKEDTEF